MFFFHSQDIGIALDATTGDFVGVDIPKQKLQTDFLFTTNRSSFPTAEIPQAEPMPLLLTGNDRQIFERTQAALQQMRNAFERTKNSSEADRKWIVDATWYELFKTK
jgi:hypothetical protein